MNCLIHGQHFYIWCWLVGCFGFNGPLRQYFSLYRAVSQREGERGEKRIDESKNVQKNPTRTYYKRSRPLPYCNPNCRTSRHWKFTQHHRTTRPSPFIFEASQNTTSGETNSSITSPISTKSTITRSSSMSALSHTNTRRPATKAAEANLTHTTWPGQQTFGGKFLRFKFTERQRKYAF